MKLTVEQMTFFTILLLTFALGGFYVIFRLWHLIPSTTPGWRVASLVIVIALLVSFFVGMAARSGELPVWLTSLLYRVGTGWMMIFFYTVLAFLVLDLLRLVHLIPRGVVLGNWLTLGIFAAVIAAIFTTGNIVYHKKRRTEITLAAPALDRPLKIVAASDLHLGFGIGRGELARWVDMINREKPDVVLFAGDVIDTSTFPLWQGDFAAELRRLDAPYGVFAVAGNHEYISGIDESLRFLEHAGIRPLRDSVAIVGGGVAIIGRDDASNRSRRTVASLTAPLFADMTTILLDHQPTHLSDATDAGVTLQISGHTHRGQIWPATWITDRIFDYSHGTHTRPGARGTTTYHITQGLGIWGGKFRLGSRSEYLVVTLTPQPE